MSIDYRKYVKDRWKSPDEHIEIQKNTAEFALFISNEGHKLLEPILQWYSNLYFDGIEPNAEIICFRNDCDDMLFEGKTFAPILKIASRNEKGSKLVDFDFDNQYLKNLFQLGDPGKLETRDAEMIKDMLNSIKVASDKFAFKEVYIKDLFEVYWTEIMIGALASCFSLPDSENVLLKTMNKTLEKYDLKISKKKEGYGVDFSKVVNG